MNSIPTQDEIAARAYEIYLREGCVEGRDMDHWLQAERELRAQPAQQTGATNTEQSGNQLADSSGPTSEEIASSRAARGIMPNSVVTPQAPIAQVTRSTTPKRGNKREAAAAK